MSKPYLKKNSWWVCLTVSLAILIGGFSAQLLADWENKNWDKETVWGGQGVGLHLTDEGGYLELDCAHATLDKPLVLDQEKRFNVPGRMWHEGGPARVDKPGDKTPTGLPFRLRGY